MAFKGHLQGSYRKKHEKNCLEFDDLGAVPIFLKRTARVSGSPSRESCMAMIAVQRDAVLHKSAW